MRTPITDAAEQTITIDCDDSCVSIYVYESDKIYEGGLVPAFVARRLEADRSALMKALDSLADHAPIMGSTGDYREGQLDVLQSISRIAKAALAAARANFPAGRIGG